MVGPPGFEPESIEPKSLNWEEYKQFLLSKYSKGYAISLFEHSKKYSHLLDNVNGIQLAKPTARNNIINGLTALSKYTGTYELFIKKMKTHGIKRVKADPIQAFNRIFNSNAHEGLIEWYNKAQTKLYDNEKLYLRFVMLSGTRAMEAVTHSTSSAELGSKYTTEYYNEETGFLEHFRYPKLFMRDSKNLYISAVPKELLDEISKSSKVSYIAIDKRLDRAGMRMRVKQLRSYYATKMREKGLLGRTNRSCSRKSR